MNLLKEDKEKIDFLYNNILSLLSADFISKYEVNLENALQYINSFYYKYLIPISNDDSSPNIHLSTKGILSFLDCNLLL